MVEDYLRVCNNIIYHKLENKSYLERTLVKVTFHFKGKLKQTSLTRGFRVQTILVSNRIFAILLNLNQNSTEKMCNYQ